MTIARPAAERFWEKVDKADDCWLWLGLRHRGYGVFHLPKPGPKLIRAHRFAYELVVGPIPDGLVIDHLCRNKGCVNPDHLEAVTQAENMRRTTRTHCKRGHELTPENVIWDAPRGKRRCRRCQQIRRSARVTERRTAGDAGISGDFLSGASPRGAALPSAPSRGTGPIEGRSAAPRPT